MNVLSLFDGMSCGQQALERAGFKVDNYFASEIDKYAIQVTMANYPNTKQLGSVINVDGYSLPKIDILIGGSPCQSFSFAGKRKGMSTKDEQEILTLEHYLQLKAEGFEFEGQSYLFWEYMRLLNETKPKYFLLENVMMGDKWEKVLSKAIGVKPIMINSALISAQNRQRLYWTNIGLAPAGLFGDLETTIEQPKDKGILLKDVLESEVDSKYFLSEKAIKYVTDETRMKKRFTQDASISDKSLTHCAKNQTNNCGDFVVVHNMMPRSSTTGKGGSGRLSRTDGKTYCLDTGTTNAVEIVAMRGRNPDNPKSRESGLPTVQMLESRSDGKTNCLTTVQKDNLVREVIQLNPSKESGGKQPYQQNRIYDKNGISPALCADKSDLLVYGCDFRKDEGLRFRDNGKSGTLAARARNDESCGQLASINQNIRRLTPIECERLQTVKDNYTNHVSDSQRYKMLGNGWTVDVIAHFFKYMK
jgi:DNA (cytosine-5)-methyltransferase 3A